MPYKTPAVSEEVQRARGRSRKAWHGGGASQKRGICAVCNRFYANCDRGHLRSFGTASNGEPEGIGGQETARVNSTRMGPRETNRRRFLKARSGDTGKVPLSIGAYLPPHSISPVTPYFRHNCNARAKGRPRDSSRVPLHRVSRDHVVEIVQSANRVQLMPSQAGRP